MARSISRAQQRERRRRGVRAASSIDTCSDADVRVQRAEWCVVALALAWNKRRIRAEPSRYMRCLLRLFSETALPLSA